MIENALRGFGEGYEILDGLADEAVSRDGGDWPDITFHQVLLLYATMGAVNQLSGMRIPAVVRVGVASLPIFLWYQHAHMDHDSDAWKVSGVKWIHKNLWKVAFWVALISNLAFIDGGEWLKGGIGLGFTLYHPLQEDLSDSEMPLKQLRLSQETRYRFQVVAQFIAMGVTLRYGDLFDKGLTLIKGALLLSLWIPRNKPAEIPETKVNVREPDFQEHKLIVDRRHVEAYRRSDVPPAPELDVGGFTDLFQSLDWEGTLAQKLKQRVRSDETWRDTIVKERKSPLEYAESGIKRFVAGLRGEKKMAGEIPNLSLELRKARHILEALQSRPPATQADILLDLAILAGHHCALGYPREIGIAYDTLCKPAPEGLFEKIGEVLASRREILFRKTLRARHNELPHLVQLIFNPDKEHNDAQFIQLYGKEAGHPRQEQANWDLHAAGHLEQKVILSGLYANTLPFFWQDYSTKEVIDAVEEAVRVGELKDNKGALIKRDDCVNWLTEQYNDSSTVGDWMEENAYDDFRLKREYITLMLVHLGFLRPQ